MTRPLPFTNGKRQEKTKGSQATKKVALLSAVFKRQPNFKG